MTTNREKALEAALRLFVDVQSRRRHPLGAPDEGIAYDAADAMAKASAALALPPSPTTLPCGCVNHDGGPYAPGCAIMNEGEAAPVAAGEHTPGPWTWHRCYDNGEPAEIAITSGRLNIASMAQGELDQEEADACLIAAAPDMLAALRDTVSDLEAFRRKFHPQDWPEKPFVHTQVLNNAKAAIARATGREK